MLHETLKALRKKKGYSQEEVAARLNIVRQTLSKWEKGSSVPAADMLIRLAELYEVTVSDLLGAPQPEKSDSERTPDLHALADQLSRINEQLVIRNRRSRRIWKTVGIIFLTAVILNLLLIVCSVTLYSVLPATTGVVENHHALESN